MYQFLLANPVIELGKGIAASARGHRNGLPVMVSKQQKGTHIPTPEENIPTKETPHYAP